MTTIWQGGEDINFPNGATVQVTTDSNYFRTEFGARCALYCAGGWALSEAFTPVSTLGYASVVTYTNGFYADQNMFGLFDIASSKGLVVTGDTATNKFSVKKYTGTYTTLATETGEHYVNSGNAAVQLVLKIVDYGASSVITLYYDGVEIISFSGDSSISGVSEFDSIGIQGANSTGRHYSEMMVADDDLRGSALSTLSLNGAGDSNDWNNTYTAIDEVSNSDADSIDTDTNGNVFLGSLTDMPSGNWAPDSVSVSARALCTDGALDLELGVKTNSTENYDTQHVLTTGWATYSRLMTQNPVTTSAFTGSEITALQFAAKAVTA